MKKFADLATDKVSCDVLSHTHIGSGTIYKDVFLVAGGLPANLIVIASQRPEMSYYMLGPDVARTVRHAKCSVMVIRN